MYICEAAFFARYRDRLIDCTDQYFPYTFVDNQGTTFTARPDFYDHGLKCYVEFKASQLNNQNNKVKADNDYEAQAPYAKSKTGLRNKQNKFQWHNSWHKQLIVQNELSKHNVNMIVVFQKNTTISTMSKNIMTKNGLNWYSEEQYADLINCTKTSDLP